MTKNGAKGQKKVVQGMMEKPPLVFFIRSRAGGVAALIGLLKKITLLGKDLLFYFFSWTTNTFVCHCSGVSLSTCWQAWYIRLSQSMNDYF